MGPSVQKHPASHYARWSSDCTKFEPELGDATNRRNAGLRFARRSFIKPASPNLPQAVPERRTRLKVKARKCAAPCICGSVCFIKTHQILPGARPRSDQAGGVDLAGSSSGDGILTGDSASMSRSGDPNSDVLSQRQYGGFLSEQG